MGRWTIAPAPGVLSYSGATYAGASPEAVEAVVRRLSDLSLVDREKLEEPYLGDATAMAALRLALNADLQAALAEADELVKALLVIPRTSTDEIDRVAYSRQLDLAAKIEQHAARVAELQQRCRSA